MIRTADLEALPAPPASSWLPYPRPVDGSADPRPRQGESVVRAERIGKSYQVSGGREIAAVSGIDLDLVAGRAILVRGPSGCGKTTLLSVVGCMVRPSEGRVRVCGRETTRLREDDLAELRRRFFGFVFQSHNLIRGLSARRNVLVPSLPRGDIDGFARRAQELLDRFGLDGRAELPVERLSGGEQQRVAIARALVHEPAVVVADEPTAHLDSAAALEFLDLVDDLRRQGRAILVASHDPVLCGAGCFDDVVRLRQGRVVEEGD